MMSIEDYQDEICALLIHKHGLSEAQVTDFLRTDSLIPHCHMKGRDTRAVADALAAKIKGAT